MHTSKKRRDSRPEKRAGKSGADHKPTMPGRPLNWMERAIVLALRDSMDPKRNEVVDFRAAILTGEHLTYAPDDANDWDNTFLDWFNELTRDPVEAEAFARALRSVAAGFEADAKYYFGKEWPECAPEPGADPQIKRAHSQGSINHMNMKEAPATFDEAWERLNEVPEAVSEYLQATQIIWPDYIEKSGEVPAVDAPEGVKTLVVSASIVNMIIRHHDVIRWLFAEVEALREELAAAKRPQDS